MKNDCRRSSSAAMSGRTPTAVAIRRDVYVGASAEDAERVVGPIVAAGYRGFDPDALVYGSVEQVADRFRVLAEMGYTDVIVRQLAAALAKAWTSHHASDPELSQSRNTEGQGKAVKA